MTEMGNTYTQLHIQFVFAVKYREALIHESWEQRLYQYITGIVQNHEHKLIAVNGMPDHVHVFVGLHPTQSVSDLMKTVKGESSEWINKEGFTKKKFRWQDGYGAFSYSHSHVPNVYKYILNKKAHHKKKTFLEEYREFLEKFEVGYDKRYIFKEPE
jgi:putative transposase